MFLSYTLKLLKNGHSSSPQMAKFGAKYAFVVIFGQILAFFAHLMPYLNKQKCEQGAKVVFQLGGYQNFWIFAQIWPQKCIFGHIGSNIGIFVGWFWRARVLYLARHLFTFYIDQEACLNNSPRGESQHLNSEKNVTSLWSGRDLGE